MADDFNKSDKQQVFNDKRGRIFELNNGERFCSISLKVGHDNKREVNLSCKKIQFDEFIKEHKLGDCVAIRFFLSGRKKERWYTTANILEVRKI